ncbi:AMP-binding protein [Calidifontimicrobium sp. SYSU G02091]|uniref:class I adenylate-forming enzyme family protein n=1 Tax=Calidifontimicrobium sp. SYSU G02091 TaxID=2926421 RepID=UPI001F53068A|nr:AMP-binding protein [Calidifontimicrobium sp. SYSU G02091]MCI1192618.1 AMP-binding protein [Calidifontimicrobium sp. SYSU G02091]
MNPALWLERSARLHAARPALGCGLAATHSYRDFADAAARTAGWLRAAGLAPGDRVGLYLRNAPEYLLALWGTWWAGGVVVPINERLHGREAGWILQHSGARRVFVDAGHAQALAGFVPDGCAMHDVAAEPAPWRHGPALPVPVERAAGDAAWLFYTSGTTGRPKGVTLTPRNLRECAMAYLATVQPLQPGDACLHPAPLSHGSGMYHLPYVIAGGVNVVPASGGFDAAEVFALATHWRRASFFAAPTLVNRLAAHAREHGADTSGLATVVYGGAPMYLADLVAAREVLGPHLAQIYGQGESPMTITVLPRHVLEDRAHPRWAERAASVGVAQPNVELSIRDADGRELPTGTPGEVCVRGDVVMAGYWRDPDATAAAIRDGWLYTGDIGRLDDEGFLTLLDRSKDLVISGGHNVYPREVEEALLLHPAVAEVAVVGRPDPEWGESLVAYVVPRGVPPDDLAARLDAHCLEHIARYKRPKVYRVVDALPKNHYGKVLKTELRAREAQSRG